VLSPTSWHQPEDNRHRPPNPNYPWTNGQVERTNRTLKETTVKRYFYNSHKQLKAHLIGFLKAYNFARRLETLKRPHTLRIPLQALDPNPGQIYPQPNPSKGRTKHLEGGEDDEDHEDPKEQAAAVGDGVDDGIFVEQAAGGDEPKAADPKEKDRDQKPEAIGVLVELDSVEIGDIEGEYNNGGVAAGGAEAAELFDVRYLVAAATRGGASPLAEVFELGEAFDEGEGEKEEDAEAGEPGGDDDSRGGRAGDDADGVEAREDDDVDQRRSFEA
jgi:hypothetical protein